MVVDLDSLVDRTEKGDPIYVDIWNEEDEIERTLVGTVLATHEDPPVVEIDLKSVPHWVAEEMGEDINQYLLLRHLGGYVKAHFIVRGNGLEFLQGWFVEDATVG